jgi:hypothetical protein
MCGIISVDKSPIFSLFRPRSVTQKGREQISITARERASIERLAWQDGRMRVLRTSSSGAKPVPYLRIPRSSPRAFLKTAPRAMALSCGVPCWGSFHSFPDDTYLQYDGHLSRDRPYISSQPTFHCAWLRQCTSTGDCLPQNHLNAS